MRVALLDARQGDRDPSKSSTVAYRNMMVLAKELDADLYVSAKQLRQSDRAYSSIICGFGSTSCEKDESVKFLERNKNAKLFWLVGEYEQSTFAPLFYARRPFEVIKNFEHKMKGPQIAGQHFVNLNTILARPAPVAAHKPAYGAVYYGRWRADRAAYFRRYLQKDVLLSTSAKNMKIFMGNGCRPKFARPLAWAEGRESLRLFGASLYIEDIFTHTHYNCPANRFYEAIACGVPLAFSPESLNTFIRHGTEIPKEMIVADADALAAYARGSRQDFQSILCLQKEWGDRAMIERKETLCKIRDLLS